MMGKGKTRTNLELGWVPRCGGKFIGTMNMNGTNMFDLEKTKNQVTLFRAKH